MLIPYKHEFIWIGEFYMDDKAQTFAQAMEWFSYQHYPRYIQTLGGPFDVRGSQDSKRKYPFDLTCSYVFSDSNPFRVEEHQESVQGWVGETGNFWFRSSNPFLHNAVPTIRTRTAMAHLKDFKASTPLGEWDQDAVKITLTVEFAEPLIFAFANYYGTEEIGPGDA